MKIDRIDILKAVALCVVSIVTGACRQELCYDHYPAARISAIWERAWERDYGMAHQDHWDAYAFGYTYASLHPNIPEWIAMVYYDNSGNVSEHYLETYGGEIILEDHNQGGGMLFYNGDTEYVVISDIASVKDARASATPRSRSTISYIQSRFPNVRSTNPPDALYAAYVADVSPIDFHEHRDIEVKLQPLVYTYLIRYEIEYGRDYVSLARGALGGMAESVYLRNGVTSDSQAIILYDCELEDWGCEARVQSFGVPGFPDSYYGRRSGETLDRPVVLNLELKLTNGTTTEFNFDVTDQLTKQPRGGVITVSGIRIEDGTGVAQGGMNVDVSDWGETEDVTLPVGPDK